MWPVACHKQFHDKDACLPLLSARIDHYVDLLYPASIEDFVMDFRLQGYFINICTEEVASEIDCSNENNTW